MFDINILEFLNVMNMFVINMFIILELQIRYRCISNFINVMDMFITNLTF